MVHWHLRHLGTPHARVVVLGLFYLYMVLGGASDTLSVLVEHHNLAAVKVVMLRVSIASSLLAMWLRARWVQVEH
jgi:hypothetical protein